MLLGTSTGAVTGAAGLALISHESKRGKGVLVGILSGAFVGGVASYLIHNQLEERDAKTRKATLFNLSKYGSDPLPFKQLEQVPGITFPVEVEDYVPTHRKGNQVIEGHRVWTLSDNAQWEREEEKDKPKD